MKKMFPLTLAAIVSTMLITSTPPTSGAENTGSDKNDLYRANELSVDIFGTGSLGKYTLNNLTTARVRQDTQFGAGAGINYFFTRNLGVGAEAYSENSTGYFIDNASANLTWRLPLGESGFAPYIFGGGGYQFDQAKAAFAQAGVGIECRFCPNMGVFVDARGVMPDDTNFYGVARLGLRFAF